MRGRDLARWWIAILLGAVITAASDRVEAGGETVTVGLGGVHLEKRLPAPLTANSLVGRIEGGWRLGPRTAGRLRLEGFRADGLNLFAALVVDVDLGARLGLSGFSGFSAGVRSGVGSNVGGGGFGRWPIGRCWAVRIDGYVTVAMRNDFSGFGLGTVVSAEWRR